MPRRKKMFMAVFIIILPLCLAFYLNYLLNSFISSLEMSPSSHISQQSPAPSSSSVSPASTPGSGVAPISSQTPETNTGEGLIPSPSPKNNEAVNPNTPSSAPVSPPAQPEVADDPGKNEIAGGVQQQIEKPIEKKDLVKAGMLILRKLSWEEINFLYHAGSQDTRTAEETKEIRKILLEKLTAEDIEVLRELGAKYGKTLNILDPNVPIK